MTRVAVFDCFSGIAGDMTMAALLDAGADEAALRAGLAVLALPPFVLRTQVVMRGGMRALHLDVAVGEERTFQPAEMRALVQAAALPARVVARALAAIGALERGEAKAHDTPAPHLHEAGGVDAVIDLVGTMLALELLGVDEAYCPVVTVGSGTMARTAHGPIAAAPGPASAHILQDAGFAVRFVEASHELVTPTGAAILAAVARPGPVVMSPSAHGAGAGTFDPPGRPNALRVFIGERPGDALAGGVTTREIVLLEANIDDMSPALLSHARDQLLQAGALDAWTEPIGMKKGRPALKLCALAPPSETARFAAIFLAETTTIGVRAAPYTRYELPRRVATFASSLGPVRVKVGGEGADARAMPEFEDVRALAGRLGRPAIAVQRLVESEIAAQGIPAGDD